MLHIVPTVFYNVSWASFGAVKLVKNWLSKNTTTEDFIVNDGILFFHDI